MKLAFVTDDGITISAHFGRAASYRVVSMETISDCQVLVGRGMGAGAYESLQARYIQPILTELHSIDEALAAYLKGNLVHFPERLH